MKPFVKVFLAVLVACLACATAASREHELEAQIMRLKSENTRLKSENMQLRSKHAVLPGTAELDLSLVEDVEEAEEEAEGEEGSEVPTGPPWCPGFGAHFWSTNFLVPTQQGARLCEEVKDEAKCVKSYSWPWNRFTTPKCHYKDGRWQASTDASEECEGDPYKVYAEDGKFAKCEFNAAQGKCLPSETITCGVHPFDDRRWGGNWKRLYDGSAAQDKAFTNKIRPQVQEECERQAKESGKDVEDVRKEYCNGNCFMELHTFNSTCEVSDPLWKSLNADVQYMGDGTEGETPRWRITVEKGYRKQALGYVSCPCKHEDNRKLSVEEALRRIAGQVATIGIDPLTAKRAIEGVPDYCKTDYYCKKDNFLLPAKWNAKVAIATYQMLECWKGSCAEGGSGDSLMQQTDKTEGWRRCGAAGWG